MKLKKNLLSFVKTFFTAFGILFGFHILYLFIIFIDSVYILDESLFFLMWTFFLFPVLFLLSLGYCFVYTFLTFKKNIPLKYTALYTTFLGAYLILMFFFERTAFSFGSYGPFLPYSWLFGFLFFLVLHIFIMAKKQKKRIRRRVIFVVAIISIFILISVMEALEKEREEKMEAEAALASTFPNLDVSDITYTGFDNNILHIEYSISNIGAALSSETSLIKNKVIISYTLLDEILVTEDTYSEVRSLQGGDTARGEATFEIDPSVVDAIEDGNPHRFTFSIIADVDEKVNEIDETDNKYIQGLSISNIQS